MHEYYHFNHFVGIIKMCTGKRILDIYSIQRDISVSVNNNDTKKFQLIGTFHIAKNFHT